MILKSHRRRVAASAVVLFMMFLLVSVRLVQLQIIDRGRFGPNGPYQSSIHRSRGAIFDRNLNKLALSVPVLSLYADPHRVTNAEAVADALAGLGLGARDKLLLKLQEKKHFVWLARKLDRKTTEAIRTLKLKGLGFKREDKRQYPSGTLAANLLGFAGIDEEGLEGIEYEHEKTLAPIDGVKLVLSGPGGLEIPNSTVIVRPPEGGYNLCLTIDDVIQHLAEKEAQTIFEKWQPKSCFIVVQEPKSGEILACAVRPTFNPNQYGSYPSWAYKNRAVTDIYEPGSVFKVVTASAALEDKRVTPETSFHCPGFVKVYGLTMGCTSIHGTINIRQAIEKSCNAVMAKVGRLVGPESLYYYIRKFGFGEKTDVELPGEAVGLLRLPSDWSGLSSSSISIGQEIGVTGMQMISAVSVIANGGTLVKPQIVRKILSHDRKKVIREPKVEFKRRVVSSSIAKTMAGMMERVVVYGTGRRGSLEQYTAAGKTGTSQKLGRGEQGRKVVSFAGFAPAENPAVTIYVVVNEPKAEDSNQIQGGVVAAPAFQNIAPNILLYMGVPPDRATGGDKLPEVVTQPLRGQMVTPVVAPTAVVAADEMTLDQGQSLNDPVARVLDAALAPLPGTAGIGEETQEDSGMSLDDGSSDIGKVIDAAVQRRYMLGTSGSTSYGP